MSCQFLVSRVSSFVKKAGQKGYMPGRSLAESKYDSHWTSNLYLRSFVSSTGALRVECWLAAEPATRNVRVIRHFTLVFHTPFACTPLQHGSVHTSSGAHALRDVLGFGKAKDSEKADADMKQVNKAIEEMSQDPLLMYAKLEPKLGSSSQAAGGHTADSLNLDSSDALLNYVKLGKESSLHAGLPSASRTPEEEDLQALDKFASLGERKDD